MPQEKKKAKGQLSRREFLKGMGSGLVGTAILTSGGLLNEKAVAAPFGEDTEHISGTHMVELRINGKIHRLEVEPRTTLLNALRERLDLTGTKEVCDRGQCGACTVMIDDKPVLSCMTLALDSRNQKITTVEGLANGGRLSPVQEAFVERDALMCGFCTPGLVVAATSLLKQNPNPSLDEIKLGLSGNVCRCGTYPKVFEAVQEASKNMRKGG